MKEKKKSTLAEKLAWNVLGSALITVTVTLGAAILKAVNPLNKD